MRATYAEFSDDLDVAALAAEAPMNRTPWALWDIAKGVPAGGADTAEIIAILEKAPARPGGTAHSELLHLYINLMEMLPHPERALLAAAARPRSRCGPPAAHGHPHRLALWPLP
jgi:hypothetical protein